MSLLDQTIPVQTVKPRQVVGKASARTPVHYELQRRESDEDRKERLRAGTQNRYYRKTREQKRTANAVRYQATKDRIARLEAEIVRLNRELVQLRTAREEL